MTKLVGILNITPDSFSDGGKFAAAEAAATQYAALVAAGAEIVDIGAESTRPGATPLGADEEWARLRPVLDAITPSIPISIDTRHATVVARALAAGAAIINDVSGLSDPAMRTVLAQSHCPVIVMHSLSIPADPAIVWGEDIDPISEILRWKTTITAQAAADGIAPARLIYDPGLGFGKTAAQSWALVEGATELVTSGGQWLYGHSRKSFLKLVTDAPPEDRDAATFLISRQLTGAGVQYLRVHNVALHAEDLCM